MPTGNKTISGPFGLPTGNALTGTEYVPMDQVQSGNIVTIKATAAQIAALSGGSGGSGGNVTPDTHPSSPTIYDDEFEYGSSIDTTGARRSGASPWSAFNASTILVNSVGQGSLVLAATGGGSPNIAGYSQPVSGSTWEYRCKMFKGSSNSYTDENGMFLAGTAGASGPMVYLMSYEQSSIYGQTYSNATTYSGAIGSTAMNVGQVYFNWIYLKMTFDGTNLSLYMSVTGIDGTWQLVGSPTAISLYGMTAPYVVGLAVSNQTYATNTALINSTFDWFRKTA
jgi:hypothetical protein